ncbi:MAG: hypothetical protein KAQ85_09510, partial [Thermodesulfovibrionia bacterium]|nr:hypothetical protein [Thermodesulfovibrionia bacterium]
MLCSEATKSGIPISNISVPSAITVADGGVDAEVKNADKESSLGMIKKGVTSFQIKTGNFPLTQPSKIKEILFKKDSSTELKERVKSCLDGNGTFAVVLFGWDNPETEDNQIQTHFRDILSEVNEKYAQAKIEIYTPNILIGFLKAFPPLALKANGRGSAQFRLHKTWGQDAEMQRKFQPNAQSSARIDMIQQSLAEDKKPVHIRILGEPGIGKTRIVFEATRPKHLSPLVIYCESPQKVMEEGVLDELSREESDICAILVVDECDNMNSVNLWSRLKYKSPKVKLISIFNEFEQRRDIVYVEVEILEKEQISNIMRIPENFSHHFRKSSA